MIPYVEKLSRFPLKQGLIELRRSLMSTDIVNYNDDCVKQYKVKGKNSIVLQRVRRYLLYLCQVDYIITFSLKMG